MADLANRFINEKLGSHWAVNSNDESFQRLLYHLDEKTNFRPFFMTALDTVMKKITKSSIKDNSVIVADVGAGVGWTSALMALLPNVKKVYSVEPNDERRKRIPFVLKHFKVPEEKVTITDGNFKNFKISEQVSLVTMVGSFHHTYDDDVYDLIDEIKSTLKVEKGSDGWLLLANEHYVDTFWILHRMLSWMKWKIIKRKPYWGPRNWLAPDPFDGEHWRTKKEIWTYFRESDFDGELVQHKGDLCKDNKSFHQRMGWHYYYGIMKLSC